MFRLAQFPIMGGPTKRQKKAMLGGLAQHFLADRNIPRWPTHTTFCTKLEKIQPLQLALVMYES